MDFANLIANGVGTVLGGGTVAAIFLYLSKRAEARNTLALGLRAAETSDEATAQTGYEQLMGTLLAQVASQDARIKNLEEGFGIERSGRLFAEEQNALRDIYIARLEAALDPPHPERPAGLII